MTSVRAAFRPEFLNRIDDILLFKRLDKTLMTGIVDIQLGYLHGLLKDRRVMLEIDDKAKLWLADKGYEPAYGARPLKRVIQTFLQNKLAEMLLQGDVMDGSVVSVSVKKDELAFTISDNAAQQAAE